MTEPHAAVVRYTEPGRSYRSTLALFALVALGFVVDLVVGGGVSHLIGWCIVAVLIAGTDALGVYAARVMRTLTVTDSDLQVGEESVPLDDIVTAAVDPEAEGKVLGRRYTDTLPRGTQAVRLDLADGQHVLVATRRPERVIELLGVAEPASEAVRPAEPDELALLPEIDERSESLFRVAGIYLPSTGADGDDVELANAAKVLVVGRPPVGFAQVEICDGLAHLRELAVLPSHMRQGYGTQLLEAACAWARAEGYPAMTLTTFVDVSWNAPYYRRRGFVDLAELTPGLLAIRENEKAMGLDELGPRIAMRREL